MESLKNDKDEDFERIIKEINIKDIKINSNKIIDCGFECYSNLVSGNPCKKQCEGCSGNFIDKLKKPYIP